MENYQILEKIGAGTYGVVYKGIQRLTGELVAIKEIRMSDSDEGIPYSAIREVSLLKELRHPNIVCLQEVLTRKENALRLVFEFLPMDLKKYIETVGNTPNILDSPTIKSLLYQLIRAVLFCHERGILHRDMKPQNLLIDPENGILKFADFGLGRAVRGPIRIYTHEVGTLWYRAPEVLLGCQHYSCSIDVWSIGCIFAEMVNRKPLFRGDSETDQLLRIFRILTTPDKEMFPGETKLDQIYFPKYTENMLRANVQNLDDTGFDLLQKMLIYDPKSRISAKEAACHDYFKDLDTSKLPALAYSP